VDVIAFRVEEEEVADGSCPVVNVYVNGTNLRDLAGVIELPFAEAEGDSDLAGDYAGLSSELVRPGARHFIGHPAVTWFGDGDTIVLGCTCGEAECWPLTARVQVGDVTVSWTDFRTGHRPWDLSRLGPFTFNREQYEQALMAAASS